MVHSKIFKVKNIYLVKVEEKMHLSCSCLKTVSLYPFKTTLIER